MKKKKLSDEQHRRRRSKKNLFHAINYWERWKILTFHLASPTSICKRNKWVGIKKLLLRHKKSLLFFFICKDDLDPMKNLYIIYLKEIICTRDTCVFIKFQQLMMRVNDFFFWKNKNHAWIFPSQNFKKKNPEKPLTQFSGHKNLTQFKLLSLF